MTTYEVEVFNGHYLPDENGDPQVEIFAVMNVNDDGGSWSCSHVRWGARESFHQQ